MIDFNVSNRLFWVNIVIYDGKYPSDKVLTYYRWVLPWHVRTKWNWYFKYRAALAQVQYPKNLVSFTWGNQEPDTRTKIDYIKKDITTKRRMITKLSNALEKHEKYLIEHSIFGLADDDGSIPKANSKIEKYKTDLQNLLTELQELQNS